MNSSADPLPVVLVTGASAGLGLAIARQLSTLPYRLVFTARESSMGRFATAGITATDRIHLLPLEVAEVTQRETTIREIERRWGGVDVLINNAGVAYRAVAEHWDDAAWRDIMEVDVRAPLDLARLVLPGMRAKRAGRILNVSSVGGMMAMPTMSLYSAAKFALEGASESLWYEVRPWGVHVSLIEPGFIRSESFRNTRFTRSSFAAAMDHQNPYHAHYQYMATFIERMMERTFATPEKVSARVVKTLQQSNPPLRVYATPDAHLFALLRRLLPRGMYHCILYRALPDVRQWGNGGSPGMTADGVSG